MNPDVTRFGRRVFTAVLIIGLIAAAAYAIDLILLVFAGMLLAVLLRGTGNWITEQTGISRRWSMLISLLGFAVLFFGSLWMFGVQMANQADQLITAVSQAYHDLQQKLQQFRVADLLLSGGFGVDRKRTRLNSSHGYISYDVFCLKKKREIERENYRNKRQCETLNLHTSVDNS